MTEYLYHIELEISINAESKQDADELADQFYEQNWTTISDGVELWGSSLIYKGEGDGE